MFQDCLIKFRKHVAVLMFGQKQYNCIGKYPEQDLLTKDGKDDKFCCELKEIQGILTSEANQWSMMPKILWRNREGQLPIFRAILSEFIAYGFAGKCDHTFRHQLDKKQ